MAASGPKSNRPRALGRLHKGGYVAKNPVPQALQRNVRDQKEAEDIMSELEKDDGLIKLLDVLERPKSG